MFRSFLTPILETVQSWQELKSRLSHKGYGIAFREGHLVILKAETGEALCTGRAMGVPLKELSHRLGRPCVKAHTNGLSGELG
ncbi:MAG: hypothetical protein QNJ09_04890 [Paracoccaceae bacterium]|nr:hypothetical protein [Paracoccaceae bacterium]